MAGASAVLLLGDYEPIVSRAELIAREHLDVRQVLHHTRAGRTLIDEPVAADWLINFLSAPRVPAAVLARYTALNIHPAPPEYPGVGSASLALYDGRKDHGVTLHLMDAEIDHGSILSVRRFPIDPRWGYGDLWDRSLSESLGLFQQTVRAIAMGEPLRASGDQWARTPVTRKQFEQHPSFASIRR